MPSTYSRGEAPVALGFEIADGDGLRLAERHAGKAERHLAGDEVAPAQGALVIEQDAGAGEEAVGFAIVDDAPMAEQLGHAIRAPRIERRRLVLRHLLRLAEHLGGRGLVEASAGADLAHGLEHAHDAKRIGVGGIERLLEGKADEALRREIVDLVGLEQPERAADIALLEQLHVDQLDVLGDGEFLEPADIDAGGTAIGADDAIAALQQRLGEIGAVLSRYARDERRLCHALFPPGCDWG